MGYVDGDGPGNERIITELRKKAIVPTGSYALPVGPAFASMIAGINQLPAGAAPLSVIYQPRWTPIIVIREDNQTCITTNVSGKNGLMKELERAFGVYVSWNCARLASGDYVIYYTRSHDQSADIATKGFNDVGLFNRLLLLTNTYSPDQ